MYLSDFLAAQLQAEQANRDYVCLTIAAAAGVTSRTTGKMLLLSDGSVIGTIGGGLIERQAIEDAHAFLGTGRSELRHYPLPDDSGSLTVLLESNVRKPLLVICGGGNVSRCLMRLARPTGFTIWLLDPRPQEMIQESIPLADRFFPVSSYSAALDSMQLPEDVFFVSASFSHETDLDALTGILRRPFAYVGMLGSRKKSAKLFGLLEKQGYSKQQLDRIHTPIGLNLGGETPEDLAVAILAELIQVKNQALQ